MRRLLALLVLLTTVLLVRRVPGLDASTDLRDTALAFGFALIATMLAGEIIERLRLPRLSGYLLFGLACGPYAGNLISRSMAADLQLVNGLAIALIAFVAGLEMNLSRLRATLPAISRLGGAVLGIGLLVAWMGLVAAWSLLPLPALDSWPRTLAVAAVVALLVVSFSPTVTIAVMTESRARGPLTDIVLPLVVLGDLVLIVGFALAMQAVRMVSGLTGEMEVGLLALLTWELLGSLAFGALVGVALAFYLREVGREVTVVLLGACLLLAGVGRLLHFEIVLASLAAGLVVENVAPPKGDALKEAVERGALPVLVVFFAAAGASLEVAALARIGGVAVVLALLRAATLWQSSRVGVRWARLPEPASLAWMGLVSQGGVTLGLASLAAAEFPGWGSTVYTLIVAMTAIHVLVGPILFRAALQRAGEVGRMDAAGDPEAARAEPPAPAT